MGTPGSGRYTTFLPVKSDKTKRLLKLFKGGQGSLYGGEDTNAKAAEQAVLLAKKILDGKGDPDMFGSGVSLEYGAAPNTLDVKWNKPGDPANPYVPDLTSPGPGKTDATDKDVDPGIKVTDVKPNFDPANPTVNTTSPTGTSTRLGTTSLGENLTPGTSSLV